MKRKVYKIMKNKNIIKALAIGISASMALQPMVVFADEEVATDERAHAADELVVSSETVVSAVEAAEVADAEA